MVLLKDVQISLPKTDRKVEMLFVRLGHHNYVCRGVDSFFKLQIVLLGIDGKSNYIS